MQQITYKGHLLNVIPSDPTAATPGVDIYCSNIFLVRADVALHPVFSLQLWLDRAVEIIKMMQLGFAC